MATTSCAGYEPFKVMLKYRFHPAAESELLEAGDFIKSDDPNEGALFSHLFFVVLKMIFEKLESASSATRWSFASEAMKSKSSLSLT